MSTGESPPVFKSGAKEQQVMESMKKTGFAALRAAVKRNDDMFSEEWREKDLVRFC